MFRATSCHSWVSAHVLSNDDLTACIREVVAPVTDREIASGRSDRFFFIRYGEGGPHIRLRLRSGRPSTEDYPAFVVAEIEEQAAAVGLKARVELVRYVPELDRYGGLRGVEIAERVFYSSSTTVLRALLESETWSYTHALNAALALHTAMAKAFQWSSAESRAFFDSHASIWQRPDCKEMVSLRIPPEALLSRWAADELPEWLHSWFRSCSQAIAELRFARTNDLLSASALGSGSGDRSLWPILSSYAHMTNNRLGLLVRDEAAVYRALASALDVAAAMDLGTVETLQQQTETPIRGNSGATQNT